MSAEEPLFRIVRGAPTAEEVAALVGAVFSRTQHETAPPAPVSAWARSTRPAPALLSGRDGWRLSGLPR